MDDVPAALGDSNAQVREEALRLLWGQKERAAPHVEAIAARLVNCGSLMKEFHNDGGLLPERVRMGLARPRMGICHNQIGSGG